MISPFADNHTQVEIKERRRKGKNVSNHDETGNNYMKIVVPDMSKPFESAHNMPLMKGLEERDACNARSMMKVQ